MKNNSRSLIILVVFLLGSLVIVQFLWIIRAAKMQEKQFEYTVILAMNKAVVQMEQKKDICSEVTKCMMNKNLPTCTQNDIDKQQWQILDSIAVAELAQNRIKIKYELKLSTAPHVDCSKGKLHKCFAIKSDIKTANGKCLWLHVTFPGRNAFIAAQIGGLFLVSLTLIVLTLIVFFRIYRYYKNEMRVSRDTRNFINNMTHELKTPLASIKLSNSRIRKMLPGDDQLAVFTNIIEQESTKLDKMAGYLLDASKLQRGYMQPVFAPVDIHPLIKKQVEVFKLQIDEKGGIIRYEPNAVETIISGDAFQFTIALANLIDNAIKYSFDQLEIVITTKNDKDSLIIEVADKGIGIDKEDQEMIFNEFSRVDTGNLHQVKGFGLGLTYVWHIVSNHDGQLLLDSKRGAGSRFSIVLPLLKQ